MPLSYKKRSQVDKHTYLSWKGDSWPSYEEFLIGSSSNNEIEQQVEEFCFIQDKKNSREINFLEVMVTYGCTLACKGCTNFSDYRGHSRGNILWRNFRKDLEALTRRTVVHNILLMGGEPLLNKDFPNWIKGLRTEFPQIHVFILTNGHLLIGNTWLIDYMKEYGDIWLKVSNHMPGADWYNNGVDLVKKNFNWKKSNKQINYVFASDLELYYDAETDCTLEIPEYDKYQMMTQGSYGNLKPWRKDPEDAFKRCMQPANVAFNDGQLYKCTMNWNLQYALGDHGQQDDPDWKPYLYKGIDIHTCSDNELDTFVSNIGKPHKICGMCPAYSQSDDEVMMDHFGTTTSRIDFKKYDKKIRRNL